MSDFELPGRSRRESLPLYLPWETKGQSLSVD